MKCGTALAEVLASVEGDSLSREFKFLVGGCHNFVALPREEIDALGLRQARGKVRWPNDYGMSDIDTYFADCELFGHRFGAILVPATSPLMGYHLFQNLRYRINAETREIEKVPDIEWAPPFA